MATVKQYNEGLNEKVILFEEELKKVFPDLRVTSRVRPRAFTKKGFVSRHAKGEAIDIEDRKDVYDYLWNTKEGISLMYKYGVGILDETTPEMLEKTGGTGAHYHIGMDSTIVPLMQKRYQELNKNINSQETFLPKKQENSIFAQEYSVVLPEFATLPEADKEEKVKEKPTEEVLKEKQVEKDYSKFQPQQQIIQQEEIPYVEAPNLNAIDFYNQANQIISMQQGGEIPVSSNGMYDYPNQKVIVPTNGSITMKNIPHNILGISLETGERKVMSPNLEYFFNNTNNVLEIPLMQKGGMWVKIDRGDGKIEKITTDSDEYRKLYNEGRVLGRKGDTLISPIELNNVTVTAFRKTKLDIPIKINEKEIQQRLENPYNYEVKKDKLRVVKKDNFLDIIEGQQLPNIEQIKKLASTYKTEEELFNLKVQKEQKLLEEERSKKREDLDLPQDKPIEALNPKNEKEVLKAQKFLYSKGYNLNPEGKFKNHGIDGKLGKATQSAISQYNKSLSEPTYTTYKKGEGFLGYCTEGQCSEFVQNENFRNLKPNIPRQKFNELTGLSGDAWIIGKNIEKAGGQKVPINRVKEGDVITLFTGGSSPYLSQAKKAGTDATHTAIVDQVNPDGSYYILHNVHEIDKVQSTLKGSPQWRGREYRNLVKNGQIVGDTNIGFIVRDAYRPNYKEVKNFEKKVKVRDDVRLTIKQDKLKKLETYNKSYTAVDINNNVNTYLKSLNNTDSKKTISLKHGLSESDYQSISKVALGIIGQETSFGTSDKADVKRVGAEVREFFGGTEASRGDAQVKYETNYGKGDLNELGINKDNFTDTDKMPLVVVDIIANHYKYFIKKGESKEKALYKAVEKYNRGKSTKSSDNYGSDYVNKVLNFANYFDVVDRKGESYKTIQDDLITEDNVVKKKIKNGF